MHGAILTAGGIGNVFGRLLTTVRMVKTAVVIARSKVFDPEWYRAAYPNLRIGRMFPLCDYVVRGARAGRMPNPLFDSAWYLRRYGRDAQLGVNPLAHYVCYGAKEGWAPSRFFDPRRFVEEFPEAGDINPLRQFLSLVRVSSGDEDRGRIDSGLLQYLCRRHGPKVAVEIARLIAKRDLPAALDSESRASSESVPRTAASCGTTDAIIVVGGRRNSPGACACMEALASQLRTASGPADDVRWQVWPGDLPEEPDLVVLRNAAATTSARWVVFARSDVLALPGALAQLVGTLKRVPCAGLIVPLIVRQDGRLAAAGCSVATDGGVVALGEGEDPDAPEFNYIKNVDCGLPHVFAVRADILSASEVVCRIDDSQPISLRVARTVRAAGLRVIYQPRAVVVSLAETGSPTAVLSRDGLSGLGGTGRFKPRVLFIDQCVPRWDQDGGSRDMMLKVKMFLHAGFRVSFWPHYSIPETRYRDTLEDLGVDVLDGGTGKEAFDRWIEASGGGFNYVFVSRPDLAVHYVNSIRRHSGARVLFYGMDIHYLRIEREYAVCGDPARLAEARRWQAMEFDAWGAVDVIYYPAEDECEVARARMPGKPVRAFPILFYDDDEIAVAPPPFETRAGLLFVGNFQHRPNADSVEWFVEAILPRVQAELPDIRLLLVGRPPPAIAALGCRAMDLVGYVTDERLAEIYRQCRLSVVPLRFGAGVKGKVVESMWHGLPVVTTPTGIQGLPGADAVVGLASDAEGLAQEIIALYSSGKRWNTASEAGRSYVARAFSRQAVAKTLSVDVPELASLAK